MLDRFRFMHQNRLTKFFSHIPVIETERLLLRRMVQADFRDMYAYARLELVTRYLLWDPHPDEKYTYRYLGAVQRQYRAGEFYDWAITLKTSGRMIGTCGFTSFSLPDDRGEIGYVLNPEYWGHGIVPEAVMAVMEFGFSELKLNRIEAKYVFGNDRSRRVMEKCGMRFEGVLRSYMKIRDRYCDIGFCSILRNRFDEIAAYRHFGSWKRPLF